MKHLFVSLIACFALATAGAAQGHGSSQYGSKPKPPSIQKAKPKPQLRSNARTWRDDDKWWNDQYSWMNGRLSFDANQGRKISAINKEARDQIRAAHQRGLRGEALSRRIQQIRAEARRKIDAVMNANQRRNWNWKEWERRWDDRWNDDRRHLFDDQRRKGKGG